MKADIDLEALGLLDGLEGDARQERVELIRWLLDRGFSIDQILALYDGLNRDQINAVLDFAAHSLSSTSLSR